MITDLQRASMWKRISAFLFDFIMLSIVAVLFGWGISMATGYDGYARTMDEALARYGEEYQVDMTLSSAEAEALPPEKQADLNAAFEAMNGDESIVNAYIMMMSLTLVIISGGILMAYVGLEFVVPLLLKNGQTLGKKIFSLAVMRNDGTRLSGIILFVRTILGKFAIETMIPVAIVMMIFWGVMGLEGTLFLLALGAVQLLLTLARRNHTPLHDLLAGTVTVDFSSQMIFNTRDDLVAYKQKAHAEKVSRDRA